MSRSTRQPHHYICKGAHPAFGKAETSRSIRHEVATRLHVVGEDFDFVSPLDRTRGTAGTRDRDYGWAHFGDGRVRAWTSEYRTKMRRK
jgi:hypothetical protein